MSNNILVSVENGQVNVVVVPDPVYPIQPVESSPVLDESDSETPPGDK